MARKRMISPEFFTSGTVARVSIPAMVTFAGLWVYCDDFGRGEDDPTLIKSVVWPRRRSISEAKVIDYVKDLAEVGLICRYTVGGYPLLHVVSWHEHQRISHRTPSKLAPCPGHEPALFSEFQRDSGGPLEKFRNHSGETPEPFHDRVVKSSSVESKLGDVGRTALETSRKALRAVGQKSDPA